MNNMQKEEETNQIKPEVTAEDIVSYITEHQSEVKETSPIKSQKKEGNTEEIVLDKSIAEEYVKTLKLNKGELPDDVINEEAEKLRLQIPPDKIALENVKTNTLPKQMENVSITDDEKDLYIRNTLLDEPISLDIKYGKLGIIFTFTSKLVKTHEYLTRYLKELLLSEMPKNLNTEETYNRIFRANISIILTQINGKSAFDDDYTSRINARDLTYEEFKKIVDERTTVLLNKSQQMWSMIINAGCIFERKEQLLAEYFVNEDF